MRQPNQTNTNRRSSEWHRPVSERRGYWMLFRGADNPVFRCVALTILGVGTILFGVGTEAAEPQSLKLVQAAAKTFVAERLGDTGSRRVVTAAELDPRLRLARCSLVRPFRTSRSICVLQSLE